MPAVVEIEENQKPQRSAGKAKRRHRWTDRVPVDEIAPQHQEVDGWLKQWGRWNFMRKERSSLASIEGLYEGSYRTAKATGAAEMVDLKSIEIERAVLRMPKQQRDTVRLCYVQQVSAHTICRIFHLRYEAYAPWMHLARCMVINLLRRNAS